MGKNSGQVAVFILLVMLLGLTVGLSVMSRTISDLKQSAVADQSSRAFTAAEAGIETALTNLAVGSGTITNLPGIANVTYTVAQSPLTGYAPESAVAKDDAVAIDLVGYTGTQLAVFWTKADDTHENPATCSETPSFSAPAALELSFYTVDASSNYSVKKYFFNPANCQSLALANDFSSSQRSLSNTSYYSTVTAAVPANAKLLRVRPLYNDASILVSPVGSGITLPPQGYNVTATAQTTGGVSRAVQVTRTNPALPPIFDYLLFTSGGLSQ